MLCWRGGSDVKVNLTTPPVWRKLQIYGWEEEFLPQAREWAS